MRILLTMATLAVTAATAGLAQDTGGLAGPIEVLKGRPYSPYADSAFPTNVYFGDTHVHTGLSADAGGSGTTLMPRDSYRLARGEQIVSNTGQPVKMRTPFDFYMITDHSDAMGAITDIINGAPNILADPEGKQFHEDFNAGGDRAAQAMFRLIGQFAQGTISPVLNYQPGNPAYGRVWDDIIDAAEEYNDPGHFTTFIAFEWTSLVSGDNLHRNVIFRDGPERAGQVLPYTTTAPVGSPNPRDLWKYLQNYEDVTRGDVIAIPHNGNLSNGMMFAMSDDFDNGKPFDADYARTRAKWERLYEATQMKGDGEAHPLLSPEDEFANFETWDFGNLDMSQAKTPDMLPGEYARSGLLRGLQLEAQLGVNPFKFGLVGASDTHTAISSPDNDNYFHKFTTYEPSPHRIVNPDGSIHTSKGGANDITLASWQYITGGVTAVWATENTRGAIFDAMQRREAYATTGPRIPPALLRRLELHGRGRRAARPRPDRLRPRRADGRRPAAGTGRRHRADLPRLCAARSDRRKPRPAADHQGLARRRGQPAGEGLRRRLVGRPRRRPGRQAAAGRGHRRSVDPELDQLDRRRRARRRLAGSRLRPGPAGLLLRPGHRDPDAALDRLRRGEVQPRPAAGSPARDSGARLLLADLVHSELTENRTCRETYQCHEPESWRERASLPSH